MQTTTHAHVGHVDQEYAEYVDRLTARLAAAAEPLFVTKGPDLFDVYVSGFADADRQYHTCSACRGFLHHFGGLATVSDAGALESAVFSVEDAPEPYQASVALLVDAVRRSRLTSVFYSSKDILGTPTSNGWHHLSVKNPRPWRSRAKAAHEGAAEKQQDVQQIQRALAEFPLPLLQQVVDMLALDAVYRSEKVLGQAQFLRDLHLSIQDRHGAHQRNLIYRAVALAPAGFCHPRTSMIGTLLEDLLAGIPFDRAAERFKAKMHPLQYQRPQAPPKAGQIEAAEKLVEKLGVAESLKRRFARLDDIGETLWRPAAAAPHASTGGVFGHLKAPAPGSTPLSSTSQTRSSWRAFEPVLAQAKRLEILVPNSGNFYGLLTAAVPDSPPIFQWDRDEQRNQVSQYVYHHGSPCTHWGLSSGWADVAVVANLPSMWYGNTFAHHARQVMFVLPTAKDRHLVGNALFPETLRSELHAIRATVEQYSQTTTVAGVEEGNANGLLFAGQSSAVTVRVTLPSGAIVTYVLDRWE